MKTIIIVNNPEHWKFEIPGVEVVRAKNYLTDETYSTMRGARVFNLCRSYKYQSIGYYVSLLALARGHRTMPGISSLQDIKTHSIVRSVSDELNELIQKSLSHLQSSKFDLSIYFGKNFAKQYERLSIRLFNLFEVPLLRAKFVRMRGGEWQIQTVGPIATNAVPEDHKSFLEEAARDYFAMPRSGAAKRKHPIAEMAILVNPDETHPPSDEKALAKFRKAADSLGIWTEFITKDDYAWIPRYDALFIRETTAVNHHTYRFARRADAEGLVVIDDPGSILRCTNKVYLEELLRRNRIRTPLTLIGHRENIDKIGEMIGFPVILKQPDSSFSQGVVKASNKEELEYHTEKILSGSELFISQEYLFTEFDWRVGIIDRKPLYVCRYYMARDHWQLYGKDGSGNEIYGGVDTLKIEDAPEEVVRTALRAASLIGDGFYGVDLKYIDGKCYVIEINDNPNVDAGYEDRVYKDDLYRKIMEVFLDRIRLK